MSLLNNAEFKMQMVSSHNSPNRSQQRTPSPDATAQQNTTPHSSGPATILNSVSFQISHDYSQQRPLSNNSAHGLLPQIIQSQSPPLGPSQQNAQSNNSVHGLLPQIVQSQSPPLDPSQQNAQLNNSVHGLLPQIIQSQSPPLGPSQQNAQSNNSVHGLLPQIIQSQSPPPDPSQQNAQLNNSVHGLLSQIIQSQSPPLDPSHQNAQLNNSVHGLLPQIIQSQSPPLDPSQQNAQLNNSVHGLLPQIIQSQSPPPDPSQQNAQLNNSVHGLLSQIIQSQSPPLDPSHQNAQLNNSVHGLLPQIIQSQSPPLDSSQQNALLNNSVHGLLAKSQSPPLGLLPQIVQSQSPPLDPSQQNAQFNNSANDIVQQMASSHSPHLDPQQMESSNSSPLPPPPSQQSSPPSQKYAPPEHDVPSNCSTQSIIQQPIMICSPGGKQLSVFHPFNCPPQLPLFGMPPHISPPGITLANSSVSNSSTSTNQMSPMNNSLKHSPMAFSPNCSTTLSQIGLNHQSDAPLLQCNDHQPPSFNNIFIPNPCPSSETTSFSYAKPPPDYYVTRSTQNQFLDGTENGGVHITFHRPLPVPFVRTTTTFAPEYLHRQQAMNDVSMSSSHTLQMGEQSFMPNFNRPKFYNNFVQPGAEMQSSQQPQGNLHKPPLLPEHLQPQRHQAQELQSQQVHGIQDTHMQEGVQNVERKTPDVLTVQAVLSRNVPGIPPVPSQAKLLGQLANAVSGQQNASYNGFSYAIQDPPFVITDPTSIVPTSFAGTGRAPSGYSYSASEMSVSKQIVPSSVTPPMQQLEITAIKLKVPVSSTVAPWMSKEALTATKQKKHLEILLQDDKEQHETNNIEPSTSTQDENIVAPMAAPPEEGRSRRRTRPPEGERRRRYKPCVVCGDRSSGYHYNVSSCEGCKGFFRRSIQRESLYSCHRSNSCEMTKGSRTSCQCCRLKRCILMGMSRDAVRGDRSKKSIDQYADKLTPDRKDLLKSILNAHRQTATPVENTQLSERLQDDRSKDPLYDKIWEFSIESAQNILEFFRKVPGFVEFCIHDRIVLSTGATAEIMIFRLCRRYNPVKETLHLSNNSVVTRESFQGARLDGIVDAVFDFAKQLHSYNLDEAEFAILCGLSLHNVEVGRLNEPRKVDYWQDKLIDLFLSYIKVRRAGNQSYAKILHVLTTIRGLGIQYSATIKSVASIRRGTQEDESLVFQLLDKPENLDVTYNT